MLTNALAKCNKSVKSSFICYMRKNVKHIILTIFLLFNSLIHAQQQNNSLIVEVAGLHDSLYYQFVQNKQIYSGGWDTLEQPKFWRSLMTMSADSALINIGCTRQIIKKVKLSEWNKLSDSYKDCYRDSVRTYYNLPIETRVFVTNGKKFFYDFENVIPTISRGIEIFNNNNVDPFYAQAILLIESPNALQKSNVGAYGSFQIMKKVAVNLGLKVNKYEDERKDFDKSAWAAAKLIRTICIPELNKILDDYCISYNPTDMWYRLMVMHVYHAGAGNVRKVMGIINPREGNMDLITTLWKTEAGGFRNASQNYSQLVLASLLELDHIIHNNCKYIYYCNLDEI